MQEHIIINEDRSVNVPQSVRKIGVQYDHNVNTITFDCPRYSGKVDLSTLIFYVNYLLPDNSPGSSKLENVVVDEENPDLIHFDWTIRRAVTTKSGGLKCLVCGKKTDAEGIETNHWNTEVFDVIKVSEGLETEGDISEENTDLITQLLLELDTTDETLADLSSRVGELEDLVSTDVDLNSMTWETGKYIDSTGNIGESDDYGISELITLPKRSTLILDATGYQGNVAMIAKSDHTPLVTSVDGKTHYEYYTDEEIQVYISCKTTVAKSAKIVRNVAETLSDLERENGELKGDLAKHPDWNQNDETAVDFVKNRPILPISEIANYGVGFGTNTALKAVIINLTKDSNADGLTFINNTQYQSIYLRFNKKQIGSFQWYYDGEISFANNTSNKVISGQCNKDRFNITYDADGNIVNSNVYFKCFKNQVLLASVDQQEDKYKTPSRDTDPATKKYVDDSVANCIKSPASAEVGQIVKIAAVDDAGKPTAWEAVDLPEQVQPDWNQNDDTATDFVKNRPFYKETLEPVPLYETAVELSLHGDDIVPFCGTNEIHDKITSADKYLVRFDGVDYTCTAVKLNNGYGLGNLSLLNGANFARPDCVGSSEREDTGEPFCIIDDQYYTPSTWFYAQTDGDHSYAVHKIEEIIHQISDEFIPDNIVRDTALSEMRNYVDTTVEESKVETIYLYSISSWGKSGSLRFTFNINDFLNKNGSTLSISRAKELFERWLNGEVRFIAMVQDTLSNGGETKFEEIMIVKKVALNSSGTTWGIGFYSSMIDVLSVVG